MTSVMGSPILSLLIATNCLLVRARVNESVDGLYNVVAVAETDAKCVEVARQLQPDAAIIGSDISGAGAAALFRRIRHNCPRTRICFLTEAPPDRDIREAGETDMAHLVSVHPREELREVLRSIALDLLGNRPKQADDSSGADVPGRDEFDPLLTLRQRQIVALLRTKASNKEIARQLGLSEGTVKVHLHSIYERVGVSGRTQLIAKSSAPD